MKKKMASLWVFCLLSFASFAQFGMTSAGFSVENNTHGISFTVGETFNQPISSTDYSFKNGILQPYSFLPSAVDNAPEIVVSIFPNPVFDFLNVETAHQEMFSYAVFDYTGRMVKYGALGDGKILVSDLIDGMYVLTLISEDGKYSYKFVK